MHDSVAYALLMGFAYLHAFIHAFCIYNFFFLFLHVYVTVITVDTYVNFARTYVHFSLFFLFVRRGTQVMGYIMWGSPL